MCSAMRVLIASCLFLSGTDVSIGWHLLLPNNLWNIAKLVFNYSRRPKLDVIKMPGDNKSVMGFNLIWLYSRLEQLRGIFDRLEALKLAPPHVGRVFAFEDMVTAMEFLQTGRSIGKVVVRIDHS